MAWIVRLHRCRHYSSDHSGLARTSEESSRPSLSLHRIRISRYPSDLREKGLDGSSSPPPAAVLMAIPVKCHHQKAQLGVLFLAADSVFRGTDRSSVKMDLNRSTPPPRIYSVHRWMVVISRYVSMLAETSQLTVEICRGRLRSLAMVVAEMGIRFLLG